MKAARKSVKAKAKKVEKTTQIERIRNAEHLALNKWIYGLNMLAYMYGPRIFREAALLSSRHWMTRMLNKKPARSGLEAAKEYVKLLVKEGMEFPENIKLKRLKGGDIELRVGGTCMFGPACTWMLEKGLTPQCARAHTIACGLNAFPLHTYKVVLKKCDPPGTCVIHFKKVK